jgi:hypothetical protein
MVGSELELGEDSEESSKSGGWMTTLKNNLPGVQVGIY